MSVEASLFSDSYSQARQRFRQAVQAQAGDLQSQLHPDVKGPNGEDLAIDFAWFGPADAQRVLLVIVGTHGYEAYAGAASVLQWLEEAQSRPLPGDTALAVVHGLNPYGWAHDSRFNEDFVDLNRNWVDFVQLPAANPEYPKVHELLLRDSVDEAALKAAVQSAFVHLAQASDKAAVLQAITGGQYSHPDGLNYGGQAPSWSRRCFDDFVAARLNQAEQIIAVDFHTGLGPHGEPFMVCLSEADSAAQARAHSIWGQQRLTHQSFYDSGEAVADYQGLLIRGLEAQLSARQQEMTGIVVEWGTRPNEVVLAALLIDRWSRFRCPDRQSAEAHALVKQMREAFYPSELAWRESVLAHAGKLYHDTVQGMERL